MNDKFFKTVGKRAAASQRAPLFSGSAIRATSIGGATGSPSVAPSPAVPAVPSPAGPANSGTRAPTAAPQYGRAPTVLPQPEAPTQPPAPAGNPMFNPTTLMSIPGVGNILQSILGSSPFGLVGLGALSDLSNGTNHIRTLTRGPEANAN